MSGSGEAAGREILEDKEVSEVVQHGSGEAVGMCISDMLSVGTLRGKGVHGKSAGTSSLPTSEVNTAYSTMLVNKFMRKPCFDDPQPQNVWV